MNLVSFVSFIVLAINFVSAQSSSYFYITNPVQGSVFEAGTTETITWTNSIDQNATITVLTGSNSLTMTSTGVSFVIQGADESYDWTIPTHLSGNGTYSLQITYYANGTSGYSYSSAFTIVSATNNSSTFASQTIVNTALPSSSVVASSEPPVSSVPATTIIATTTTTTTTTITATTTATASVSSSFSSVITTATSVRPIATLAASTTPTPSVSGATMKTTTFASVCFILLVTALVL